MKRDANGFAMVEEVLSDGMVDKRYTLIVRPTVMGKFEIQVCGVEYPDASAPPGHGSILYILRTESEEVLLSVLTRLRQVANVDELVSTLAERAGYPHGLGRGPIQIWLDEIPDYRELVSRIPKTLIAPGSLMWDSRFALHREEGGPPFSLVLTSAMDYERRLQKYTTLCEGTFVYFAQFLRTSPNLEEFHGRLLQAIRPPQAPAQGSLGGVMDLDLFLPLAGVRTA